ncbi:MAG: hypothetical protein ACI4XJ_08775 [Eubacteriales bacterium]
MSEWREKAEQKLKDESKPGLIKGQIQKVIAMPIKDALETFINQSNEFAQAVAQSGCTFAECLDAVAKDVKTSISDIEAYRRAVGFYFPGAKVEMSLTIRMSEYETGAEKNDVTLSLFDLM